jgi:hypothetical protein
MNGVVMTRRSTPAKDRDTQLYKHCHHSRKSPVGLQASRFGTTGALVLGISPYDSSASKPRASERLAH